MITFWVHGVKGEDVVGQGTVDPRLQGAGVACLRIFLLVFIEVVRDALYGVRDSAIKWLRMRS